MARHLLCGMLLLHSAAARAVTANAMTCIPVVHSLDISAGLLVLLALGMHIDSQTIAASVSGAHDQFGPANKAMLLATLHSIAAFQSQVLA